MKRLAIAVVDYPSASKSAVYGLLELLELANNTCQELDAPVRLCTKIYKVENLNALEQVQVVILPPCNSADFYTKNCVELNDFLHRMHTKGAVLASACVGSFILARAGFLDNKFCTTHWRLAHEFTETFPQVKLNVNAIMVKEGNVITAGGRMAWVDLAFEIISSFCSHGVAAKLSKEMVVDTGYREQKFYRQFIPQLDHGDELILRLQSELEAKYAQPFLLAEIADQYFVSTRTLQRRFHKALGISVIEYLQKLRLHNACQHLELSQKSVSEISYQVGYQNVNAFRKVFVREYGLTPSEFRKRFAV